MIKFSLLNGRSLMLLSYCEWCCFQDNGGCSDRAVCNNVAPHQRTCTCRRFSVGDGFTCIGDIMEVTRKTTINRKSGFQLAISEFSGASVSKRVRNLSHESEFCMQFHFHTNQSHFHENCFALRFTLKQSHKGTRKWLIECRKTKTKKILFHFYRL